MRYKKEHSELLASNWLRLPNSRTATCLCLFRFARVTRHCGQTRNAAYHRGKNVQWTSRLSGLLVLQFHYSFLPLNVSRWRSFPNLNASYVYIYLIMFLLLKKIFHYFLMHIHTNLFLFYFAPSSRSWSPLAGLGVSATTFIFHIRALLILATLYNSLSLAYSSISGS